MEHKTQEQTSTVREHFTFFRSFREQIDLCEEGDQLRLYRAITDFALFHIDTDFDEPLLNMAWIGIKPHLENGWIKYSNGKQADGKPKPTLRGNKNASKDDEQTKNEAKTKRNQSENNTIVMECNGMDSIVEDNKESTIVPKKKVSLTIEQRKEDFLNDVRKYTSDYPSTMLNDFFSFWTEPNKSGTKMRFELERTWDTKRRLRRWSENTFNK